MAPKRKASSANGRGKKIEDDGGDGDQDIATSSTPKRARLDEMAASLDVLNQMDFDINANTENGDKWNMKIVAWNVNGIRAWLQKGGLEYVKREDPDMFCVMETKCAVEKIPATASLEGYTNYWLSGDSEGYSGVGLYTKIIPLDIVYGIGIQEHDTEGRVITAEYEKFFLVAAYVPNAGRKLVRLDHRKQWDIDFREYLHQLDSKKPVILCGDLNVAHEEIDLANPKTNKKNAGFSQEERDGFTQLLNDNSFVDSFRHLHPQEQVYTFWTYMMNARKKNVGWRLDYFVLSKALIPHLCEQVIRTSVLGSDHCPIALCLSI